MPKEFLKKHLPKFLMKSIQKRYKRITMYRTYIYDLKRYSRYSKTNNLNSRIKLEGIIIKEYHVIEKGLTMPSRRLGFGRDKMISLCNNCLLYIGTYGVLPMQVEHAISVIKEYCKVHDNNELKDTVLFAKIEELLSLSLVHTIESSSQIHTTRDEYFAYTNSSFNHFSESRKSIRNYINQDIPLTKIKEAIKLSLNYPSACNRQTARVYLYTDKEQIDKILEIQGGNRGFGHLTNKLIVITAELGVFEETTERNQAFIDGGIYLMNLLYALHQQEIGCCTLNCGNTPKKDETLQKICGTKKSEVFIAMITCGILPSEFSVALSPRYSMDEVCTID